jgi:sugar lactone lactonase YvrE
MAETPWVFCRGRLHAAGRPTTVRGVANLSPDPEMKLILATAVVLALSGCAALPPAQPKVELLVDLDPASTDRTVIVENLVADRNGLLYTADRVSGNVLRIDPKSPRPVVVARIEARQINGQNTPANASGLAFNAQGDLLIAANAFNEVLRVPAADLNPAKPGLAQPFATGTPGANGIVFDRAGNLFVSGSASGTIFRVAPAGGAAQAVAQIEKSVRTLPDGKTQQAFVANGLAFEAGGTLVVADTSRGALWQVPMAADGSAGKPVLWVQSPLLEGADGLAFDARGNAWVAANELNAVVLVTPDGKVSTLASSTSQGPLEFPGSVAFVGEVAYVVNFDVPRRVNMDAGGTTARDGVGASVVRITR